MLPVKYFGRLIFLGVISFILFFSLEYYHFAFNHIDMGDTPYEFEVAPGSTILQLAHKLDQANILPHSRFFIMIARLTDQSKHLKAGEYRIEPGTTPKELLSKLVSGEVFHRKITIVEGWNVQKLLKELHESPYLTHDLKGLSEQQIRKIVGVKEQALEGLFFPETYLFTKYYLESDILKIAYQLMQEKLKCAWEERDKNVFYLRPYQALIVASLVEKETALANEKNKVAGVILRRIKKKMPLQIDPTVIYGLGSQYNGKLTKEDLQLKSPYNTYKVTGLPPTPIAIPDEASILAAMHPDNSQAIYFVADGQGRHVFSDNLEEHNKAVKKYRQTLSSEKIENLRKQ